MSKSLLCCWLGTTLKPDQGGGIEVRMKAACISWRHCCLTSDQGQGRVLKEPVSPGSSTRPLRFSASLPQHGFSITLIRTVEVISIAIPISPLPNFWTGKKAFLLVLIVMTIFAHEPSANSLMKREIQAISRNRTLTKRK